MSGIGSGVRLRTASMLAGGVASFALLLGAGAIGADLGVRSARAAGPVVAVEAAPPLAAPPASAGYADVVVRVAPSIVTVRAERLVKPAALPFDEKDLPPVFREFGFNPRGLTPHREGGLGSGVIVSADGYVLTNNHVVENADKVKVDLPDRRTLDAKVVGADGPSDLAILKVEAAGLPALPFGNSDAIRVGDVVLAFGNPLGVGQTVTMGIVSAKGRATGVGDGSFEDFLQTDAPINQGNSGGALVDTQGRLVGINSQILSPSGGNIGIGFAIPAKMAETVMSQLVHGGHVRRAQLGVTVQGVTSDLAESLGLEGVRGALVSDVSKDSPGERAGLERGDVIVSVDGHAVDDGNALRNRIAGTAPGTSVALGIVRDGHPQTLHANLGELRSAQAGADANGGSEARGRLGLAVRPVTPDEAAQLHLDSKTGLVVAQVDPAGPAADSGIRPGDVIEQVNRRPVNDVGQLKAAVAASPGRPVLLLVNRDGQSLFLTVEAPRA